MKKQYKRCCVVGCSNPHASLHGLPASEPLRSTWLSFIFHGNVPTSVSKFILVCAKHFTDNCFTNHRQYTEGFADMLRLIKGSVPSIFGNDIPSTSRAKSTQAQPKVAAKACQTKSQMCSVGTQLSWKTLRPHVKSKGSQCSDVEDSTSATTAVQTHAFPSSTPVKRRPSLDIEKEVTAIKRSRLEQSDVGVGSLKSSATTGSTLMLQSPEDSNSALTEDSGPMMDPMATYIVYKKRLLELFEVCPLCQRVTRVRSRTVGTFLCVEQRCPHCGYTRTWNSQPLQAGTPARNLQLSVAGYSNGGSFYKVNKIFRAMRRQMFQRSPYRRHARLYIEPTIIHKWKLPQDAIMEMLRTQDALLGGDMRADSPGLSKKMVTGAKNQDCPQLSKWLHRIKNHIYWTAASSTTPQERIAKWASILHHVQDIHTHPAFTQCLHLLQTTRDESKWLKAATPAFCRLENLLTSKKILKERLGPHLQTSAVEAFHSVVLLFDPKINHCPFLGMLCRLYLAAMHFHENPPRLQAIASLGAPKYRMSRPKYKKGERTSEPIRTPATSNYVDDIMELVFENGFPDPIQFIDEVVKINIPPTLSFQHPQPDKATVVSAHFSRFNPGPV